MVAMQGAGCASGAASRCRPNVHRHDMLSSSCGAVGRGGGGVGVVVGDTGAGGMRAWHALGAATPRNMDAFPAPCQPAHLDDARVDPGRGEEAPPLRGVDKRGVLGAHRQQRVLQAGQQCVCSSAATVRAGPISGPEASTWRTAAAGTAAAASTSIQASYEQLGGASPAWQQARCRTHLRGAAPGVEAEVGQAPARLGQGHQIESHPGHGGSQQQQRGRRGPAATAAAAALRHAAAAALRVRASRRHTAAERGRGRQHGGVGAAAGPAGATLAHAGDAVQLLLLQPDGVGQVGVLCARRRRQRAKGVLLGHRAHLAVAVLQRVSWVVGGVAASSQAAGRVSNSVLGSGRAAGRQRDWHRSGGGQQRHRHARARRRRTSSQGACFSAHSSMDARSATLGTSCTGGASAWPVAGQERFPCASHRSMQGRS